MNIQGRSVDLGGRSGTAAHPAIGCVSLSRVLARDNLCSWNGPKLPRLPEGHAAEVMSNSCLSPAGQGWDKQLPDWDASILGSGVIVTGFCHLHFSLRNQQECANDHLGRGRVGQITKTLDKLDWFPVSENEDTQEDKTHRL